MEKLGTLRLEKGFERFERAAAKGHEESIWITGVAKGAKMEKNALKEAFAKTETPLGWYFAGKLSEWDSREGFDFFKRSAEGGCSCGQLDYGQHFGGRSQSIEEPNPIVRREWLEKAANQNNPWAMEWLGLEYRDEDDKQKARSYYRAAAEVGWKMAMNSLGKSFLTGWGCVQDLRQAMIWGAKAMSDTYFSVRNMVKKHLLDEERLEVPVFNEYCFWLGWGLYWYLDDDISGWLDSNLLDCYIACDTEQKKALTTFLVFWNQTTGVKGPGQMIGQMVWKAKGRNLLVRFDEWITRSECEDMDVSGSQEEESDWDDSELELEEEYGSELESAEESKSSDGEPELKRIKV
jgi:TPR repeat protein